MRDKVSRLNEAKFTDRFSHTAQRSIGPALEQLPLLAEKPELDILNKLFKVKFRKHKGKNRNNQWLCSCKRWHKRRLTESCGLCGDKYE